MKKRTILSFNVCIIIKLYSVFEEKFDASDFTLRTKHQWLLATPLLCDSDDSSLSVLRTFLISFVMPLLIANKQNGFLYFLQFKITDYVSKYIFLTLGYNFLQLGCYFKAITGCSQCRRLRLTFYCRAAPTLYPPCSFVLLYAGQNRLSGTLRSERWHIYRQ